MVNASQSFREAVRDGEPQRCLLDFYGSDTIFSNEDIDMDAGIKWTEPLNTDQQLTIGKAPSASISFTLFNDDKKLANYKFGNCRASIGAMVVQQGYVPSGVCHVESGGNTITGNRASPYLRINGNGANIDAPWPVASMLLDGDTLYAINADGDLWTATYSGTRLTKITSPTLNTHMKDKVIAWAAENRGLYRHNDSKDANIFYVEEITNEVRTVWEYVRLGTFKVKRPASVRGREIEITAYDRMTRFDVSFKNKVASSVTYPITAKNLLRKICEKRSVTLNESSLSVMVNDLTLTKASASFNTLTCRDMIRYIAQQGGCYARMNRAGELEMAWFKTTSQSFDEEDYEDFDPSWYDDASVDEVHNRPDGSKDEKVGSGDNAYLISGNPFLM